MISKDLFVAGLLIVLMYICYMPLHMPMALSMMIHAILVMAYVAFALFMWREQAHDERDEHHQMIAARLAFIVGGAILIIAIVKQGIFVGEVDPWLLLALTGMVLAKIVGRIWAQKYR